MFFEQYELEPALAVVRFLVAYSGRPDDHRDLIEQGAKSGYRVLDTLEAHIGGREWLVGDSMTLADVALYAYTHVAPEGGFDLERYPGIRRWLERVAAEPGHVAIDA